MTKTMVVHQYVIYFQSVNVHVKALTHLFTSFFGTGKKSSIILDLFKFFKGFKFPLNSVAIISTIFKLV